MCVSVHHVDIDLLKYIGFLQRLKHFCCKNPEVNYTHVLTTMHLFGRLIQSGQATQAYRPTS